MDDAGLMASWQLALLVLGLVVVIAAALLIAIWLAARRIHRLALEALRQVERIQANTSEIWGLKTTNQVAGEILSTATEIEENGSTIASTLTGQEDESGVA